jgi:NAD(P)-dependent dehydrogenase (short-subunit alcohol dehydrogenase family)
MRQLAGRSAVVTGAANGIGLSLADQLAREGMNLVLADVDVARLEAVVDRLCAFGANVVGVQTDVAEPAQLDELAATTVAEFGPPHLVCANAGVNRFASFQELTLDDWDWIVGVNLMGVVHTVRSFLPCLLEGRDGCLAITGSMAALMCGVNRSAYNATKHAVWAIAESVAAELASLGRVDVGVSLLCPGPVRTDIANAGRHRSQSNAQPSDGDRDFAEYLVSSGVDPDEVAALLIDAVKNDRRYVFTHADLARTAVEQRNATVFADLLE